MKDALTDMEDDDKKRSQRTSDGGLNMSVGELAMLIATVFFILSFLALIK